MDYPPNPHDLADSDGTIRLPANLTTVLAEDLRARLVLAADRDEEILIDAGDVESIGQAGLQLLIAARNEADRLGLPFAIDNLSDALATRLTALGLADALALSRETKVEQEEMTQ